MNIDERIDSIVFLAAKEGSVKASALLVLKGAARLGSDLVDKAEMLDGAVPPEMRKLFEAIDARAEELSEAVAKNTIADERPDGPATTATQEVVDNTTANPAPAEDAEAAIDRLASDDTAGEPLIGADPFEIGDSPSA